eukprot:CAMPEP_0174310814 /NCGR_PEP_ID=MMETSP0810-20121108/3297_1 /TAXON_ID=73025 ORGANISM="Eutreptiella gymnastica-like, Strain CCMP1594" /NCGR_SAMPLE_ID=MMETSP0810 /ASSEMBLY_ACC=CAM_ASM_000659 /LENGTH=415 /DNA_ID=CAMNT_0015418845 /DNA_START=24 /DNA_END=1272 /DNA_ORIENTATION=-
MADNETPSNAPEHCPGTASEAAGKAAACAGCPNQATCASAPKGPDPDIPLIQERMTSVKHKVMVLSGKGGVGKSTLTKELGLALGNKDFQVGLIDADICGPSLPRLVGVRQEEVHMSNDGWEPVAVDETVSVVSVGFMLQQLDQAVIFQGAQKNGLIKDFIKNVSWGDLDILLIDTPPGTSDEHLSLASFFKQVGGCDGAIVVTTPQDVAIADVRKEIAFCRKAGVPVLGVVENMSGFVCPKCTKTTEIFKPKARGPGTKKGGEKLAEDFGVPFWGRVPLDPRLMQSCEEGVALSSQYPDSPASKALGSIADLLVTSIRLEDGRLEVDMDMDDGAACPYAGGSSGGGEDVEAADHCHCCRPEDRQAMPKARGPAVCEPERRPPRPRAGGLSAVLLLSGPDPRLRPLKAVRRWQKQ